MNKKAIYNFVTKINAVKNLKDMADTINTEFIQLTGAYASWVSLINWNNNQVEVRKILTTERFKQDKNLEKEVKNIKQTISDFYKNFGLEEIYEHLSYMSNTNKILKPIIYRNNILGYVGLISADKNFNKNYITEVEILIEYISARLEIITLYDEKRRNARERTEFLASVSHEFKTPLNAIIGFCDLLSENIENEENLKYLNNISNNSVYLMSLIKNILEYARSDSQPLTIKKERIRTKQLINEILQNFEEMRKEKNITFNYTLSDIIINADIIRFKQLVYNLISNALKFSKENSKVSIVTYVNRKKEFVFEIRDKGDGISKKDITKIFNFFTQVNRSELKRQQGSGVGLALCRKILQAHGGEIFVKSKLHQGSTFWFTLPLKQKSKSKSE